MQVPTSPSCGNVRSRFANRADVTALLAAFCFFLSAIEYMLPKPLPFMRLGIANLPILLAVDLLPFKWFLVLAAAKVVGMSIVSGTLFSYVALFSLAGTMIAALVMRGVRRAGKGAISLIGVSIAGAVASNATQMLIARFVIFGEVAWLIAPLFLLTGLITGTLMGFFAEYFVAHSNWYSCAMGESDVLIAEGGTGADTADTGPSATMATNPAGRGSGVEPQDAKKVHRSRTEKNAGRFARRQRYESLMEPWVAAILGVAIALLFLLQQGLLIKTLYLLLFILWTWLAGKRFSLVSTLVVMAGIVAANLLIPSGRVLFKLGPLVVTEFALTEGLAKALTFEGLMYLSKAAIMQGLHFPGRFGTIIAQAFQYYDRIIEYRGKVHAKTAVRDIDVLLQEVWLYAWLAPGVDKADAGGAPASATAPRATTAESISRILRSLLFAAVIAAVAALLPFALALIAK
ncbi:MAG: Gx transporter family protein [Rectinema sp.]